MGSGAGSVDAPESMGPGSGCSRHGRHAGPPVAAAADASLRELIESGLLVLEATAAMVSTAVHCAVEVLHSSDTAGHKASEGVIRSLHGSRLLDAVCSCLLRLDPAHPPCLGKPDDTVIGRIMVATRDIISSVHMAAPSRLFGPRPAAPAAILGTLELRMQLVTQPHVLHLLHAVMESFLQAPPPLSAVGVASGAPASSNASSAAALATPAAPRITRMPAWEAFLPSASPSDVLSNKALQKTWPLLAACPFARHMYDADAVDVPKVQHLKAALWFLARR